MWPYVHVPFLRSPVALYDVAHYLAWICGVGVGIRLAREQGISPTFTIVTSVLCVVASIVGARILDLLEYWASYASFHDLFARGGSSIYGGFVASFAVAWAATRVAGVSPLKFLDVGGPAIALSEGISRLGCFASGCCYGVPWNVPWAVVFPVSSFAFGDQQTRGLIPEDAVRSLPVHPVQLYNVALEIGLFVLLLRMLRRPHRDGHVFFAFLAAYGALRLLLAPFRMEALSSMKAFSVAFIVVGLFGLVSGRAWGVVGGAATAGPRR